MNPKLNTVYLNILIGFFIVLALTGCSTPPSLNTSAVNTPVAHPENKVLFLQFLTDSERRLFKKDFEVFATGESYEKQRTYYSDRNEGTGAGALPADTRQYIPLKQGYEVSAPDADIIKKDDPITIILNGIWLPAFSGKKDIAVILDIATKEGDNQPVVAFYQRDVPGNMMLNFKNLTVYTNEKWDGKTQPYFRLRILDAKSERNQNTQAMMESASELSGSISGIIPSASLPQVALAIDIAKFVLGNRKNQILLDYTIQFYSSGKPDRVGGNLDEFAEGNWLVVGRPRDSLPDFWDAGFYMDRKQNVIRRRKSETKTEIDRYFVPRDITDKKEISFMLPNSKIEGGLTPMEQFQSEALPLQGVPYLSTIVIKEDYSVPAYVTQAQSELTKLITNGEARTKPEDLVALFKRGVDVSTTQELVKSFESAPSAAMMQTIMGMIDPNNPSYIADGFVARQVKELVKKHLGVEFVALQMAEKRAAAQTPPLPLKFATDITTTGTFEETFQNAQTLVVWRWNESARNFLGIPPQ